MIYMTSSLSGANRLAHLDDIYKGCACMLLGGAPTLKDMDLGSLEARGVLVAAMNNAAIHFRPRLWFSGDNPASYDPRIVQDPGILKFAPHYFADEPVKGKPYKMWPGTVFYIPDITVQISDLLQPCKYTPFYNNTLFAAIHILYMMGVRTIILAGCDFELGAKGEVYAHADGLTDKEKKANVRLYDSLAKTLVYSKPLFEAAGLTLMDASVKTKLEGHYRTVTMAEAVGICSAGMANPAKPEELPHGTRFVSESKRLEMGLSEAPEIGLV